MKKMKAETSHSEYTYTVGKSCLSELAVLLRGIKADKAVIVTDSNVGALYCEKTAAVVKEACRELSVFTFAAGEASKTPEVLTDIFTFLCEHNISKNDCLIALGGGVCGDITGLAASLYMRGIKYIQLPTTLLSAVDSSVGGKTAVNLGGLKNIIGSFYQPCGVVCDISFFNTLPAAEFKGGLAEIIKYGIIEDKELTDILMTQDTDRMLEDIIYRCVKIKTSYVKADEYDRADRRKLNFGHTVGHAIEKVTDFTISHGFAVAYGMYAEAAALSKRNLCLTETVSAIKTLCEKYVISLNRSFDADELYKSALHDKKNIGGKIALTAFKNTGDSYIYELSLEDFEGFIFDAAEALKNV